MFSSVFSERFRSAFAPPRYLAFPLTGVAISAGSIRATRLVNGPHGFVIKEYTEVPLPDGAYVHGEIIDQAAITNALVDLAKKIDIIGASVSLPESKSFLFEAQVPGSKKSEWRVALEQKLAELVPLPPAEVIFDIVRVGHGSEREVSIVGVASPRNTVDTMLEVFDQAHIPVRALEDETFALTRALFPKGDATTSLLVDLGKDAVKIVVVEQGVPRFATTVYKDDLAAPMVGIQEEIVTRFTYWQEKEVVQRAHEPIARAFIIGEASLAEELSTKLQAALQVPIQAGDVYTNLAPHDAWSSPIASHDVHTYATAIGLALYDSL